MNDAPRFPEEITEETEHIEELSESLTEEACMHAKEYTDTELESIGQTEGRKSWAKELYEWVSSIAIAVVLALLINQFVFALVMVDGQSMEPTLHHNERLVVRKAFYTPEQGDIVILKSEAIQKFIVKRIIALPGQTIDFDNRMDVYVDGEMLTEPYINQKQISSGNLYAYPLTVPKKGEVAQLRFLITEANLKAGLGTMTFEMLADGTVKVAGSELVEDGIFEEGKTTYKQDCYFVMGDNRNHSSDSRTLGLIPASEVVGKSSVRVFPFSQFGLVK